MRTTRSTSATRDPQTTAAARARKRFFLLLAVPVLTLGLLGAATPTKATAMPVRQTTLVGTVNTVYWDLDAFWRMTFPNNYVRPTVGYYNGNPSYVAACGNLYAHTIMAYCPGNQIWIHQGVNQSKVTRLGDYAAGFFVAHEFGHHMATRLGLASRFKSVRGRELYADCMAGVFTRYGYSYSGRLDASDYWEGYNSLGDIYPNEGGANGYPLKADRKAWYQYGFNQYNTSSCALAVNY